jgi:UDP-N-acetylbacillosamine transaminase
MHLQPAFSSFNGYLNGNSESFFKKGICFPSGSGLNFTELDEITWILSKLVT